jgi:hypothetical protein
MLFVGGRHMRQPHRNAAATLAGTYATVAADGALAAAERAEEDVLPRGQRGHAAEAHRELLKLHVRGRPASRAPLARRTESEGAGSSADPAPSSLVASRGRRLAGARRQPTFTGITT